MVAVTILQLQVVLVLHGLNVNVEVVAEDVGLDSEHPSPVEAAPLREHA